jgi:hypothetical protein
VQFGEEEMVLVSTEAKQGGWVGGGQMAKIEGYCGKSGRRIFSRSNVPFDVCGEWIGGYFVAGENLSVSVRGTYHQTLGICNVKEPNRALAKIHFRFAEEAFVHLCRISACTKFLAVSCGAGEALSDSLRVIPVPDELGDDDIINIRIPRLKFSKRPLQAQDPQPVNTSPVPSFFCGGAIVGMEWSRVHPTRIFANVRRYVNATTDARPDISNTVELQTWDVARNCLISRIPGACGLTTKECPFYLFLCESPCGQFVASGSEDANVYIYSLRHERLLRVLKGVHSDVVSSVAWHDHTLVTASDDRSIAFWTSSNH